MKHLIFRSKKDKNRNVIGVCTTEGYYDVTVVQELINKGETFVVLHVEPFSVVKNCGDTISSSDNGHSSNDLRKLPDC